MATTTCHYQGLGSRSPHQARRAVAATMGQQGRRLSAFPTLPKRPRTLTRKARGALRAEAMVNIGFSPAFILGTLTIVSGLALYNIQRIRPNAARSNDVVVASMLVVGGSILLFQGWRLDPVLFLGQLLVFLSVLYFAYEAVQLRANGAQSVAPPPMQDFRTEGRMYRDRQWGQQGQGPWWPKGPQPPGSAPNGAGEGWWESPQQQAADEAARRARIYLPPASIDPQVEYYTEGVRQEGPPPRGQFVPREDPSSASVQNDPTGMPLSQDGPTANKPPQQQEGQRGARFQNLRRLQQQYGSVTEAGMKQYGSQYAAGPPNTLDSPPGWGAPQAGRVVPGDTQATWDTAPRDPRLETRGDGRPLPEEQRGAPGGWQGNSWESTPQRWPEELQQAPPSRPGARGRDARGVTIPGALREAQVAQMEEQERERERG